MALRVEPYISHALGDKISQTVNGSTLVYVYQGLNIIYEKNLTSGVVTDHYYANSMQVAKSVSGQSYYFQNGLLGGTRLVTASSGSIVFSTNYEPYGLAYGATGYETFMYNDKPYDSVTGLYYYNARFYDPSVQRFVTEDTYTFSMPTSMEQNRYAYASDNPVIFTDPTGHYYETIGPFGIAIGLEPFEVHVLRGLFDTLNILDEFHMSWLANFGLLYLAWLLPALAHFLYITNWALAFFQLSVYYGAKIFDNADKAGTGIWFAILTWAGPVTYPKAGFGWWPLPGYSKYGIIAHG